MLFIFDANYPHEFVRGLSIMDKADKHSKITAEVMFVKELMGTTDAEDLDIVRKASKRNAVIVTHDKDFKRIKHYKAALIEHQVGYIYFKVPSGKYLFWDMVKAFINKWGEIKDEVSKAEHPFAFEIDKFAHLHPLPF
jgi:hypothetical protein